MNEYNSDVIGKYIVKSTNDLITSSDGFIYKDGDKYILQHTMEDDDIETLTEVKYWTFNSEISELELDDRHTLNTKGK